MSFGVSDLPGSPTIATTAAGLAGREAFRLGETLIVPSSREVRGPGGGAIIEPRVMQVLLVLADAAGAVVTREDLIRLCWNSQIVGEDAINRAVAEVRRVARTLAADGFAIETIPRTGYRLTGATPNGVSAASPSAAQPAASRRLVLGAAGLAVASAAAAAGWALWPNADARHAADLAAQAKLAMNGDLPEGVAQAVQLLRAAVASRPGDAKLWGKLALAWCVMAEIAGPGQVAAAVQGCELAAARALALDPRQADARVGLILLRSSYGDWLVVERKLRTVLVDAPTNIAATEGLAVLLQVVGRTRESGELNGAIAAREPLSPVYQYRRTYNLWSAGKVAEADRTIDRAIELWPRHPGVWFARLWLMGFTGRTQVALAQIADIETRPPTMSDASAALLRLSMQALQTGDAGAVDAAVAANVNAALSGPGGSVNAILILTALKRLDEAFAVAEGYLLRRGSTIMPLRYTKAQTWVNDQRHRKTQMLFVPVTAPLRADPRFLDLCRGSGLADYWRQSGRWPDFLGSRRI